MAHAHESHTAKIWKVFGFLSLVTIVEVVLGIFKPDSLYFTVFLGTTLLNWIFIILTLVKAYGIAWSFMHLEGEKKWFRRSIVWPLMVFVCYLLTLLLIEAVYVFDVLSPYVRWVY